jgi:hypothetical protein
MPKKGPAKQTRLNFKGEITMFDIETINKTATENVAKINSAALEFTRAVVESAQKNMSVAVDLTKTAQANTLARDWMDFYQDSAKNFASVFTAPATKSK